MTHTVVNGANGSVTWCQGFPFCPRCVAEQPASVVAVVHHCPGCRCQPAIRLGGGALPPKGCRTVGIGA